MRYAVNYWKSKPTRIPLYKCPVTSGLLQVLFTRSLAVGQQLCSEAESDVDAKDDKKHDPSIDRTTVISVETSKKYLKSEAYKETYGNNPVWSQYRRNHKGAFPPRKTRKTCIRGGVISAGNPCPICRDEYLVLHHENMDLLNQFISPHTGEVLSYSKTGLCQKRHLELLVAIEKAKDYGFITFDVPFREYDYSLYYKP